MADGGALGSIDAEGRRGVLWGMGTGHSEDEANEERRAWVGWIIVWRTGIPTGHKGRTSCHDDREDGEGVYPVEIEETHLSVCHCVESSVSRSQQKSFLIFFFGK